MCFAAYVIDVRFAVATCLLEQLNLLGDFRGCDALVGAQF